MAEAFMSEKKAKEIRQAEKFLYKCYKSMGYSESLCKYLSKGNAKGFLYLVKQLKAGA